MAFEGFKPSKKEKPTSSSESEITPVLEELKARSSKLEPLPAETTEASDDAATPGNLDPAQQEELGKTVRYLLEK